MRPNMSRFAATVLGERVVAHQNRDLKPAETRAQCLNKEELELLDQPFAKPMLNLSHVCVPPATEQNVSKNRISSQHPTPKFHRDSPTNMEFTRRHLYNEHFPGASSHLD